MKGIVVLTMEFPSPDSVPESLAAMDPPSIPHFAGEARIAVGEDAQKIIDWLDEETE